MNDSLTSIFDWFLNNKEWCFSGIGVTILAFLMNWLRKFFAQKNDVIPANKNVITQTINIVDNHKEQPTDCSTMRTPLKSKSTIQILFIDDNKVSFIPAMKKAGYSLIRYIKDCNNIHCQQIKDAEIIFVDVNGVGMSLFPQEQGFGLARAIKQQYPSKCIVLYSAEPQYFRKDYKYFDSVLPKNSEPYEFTKIIDDWIQDNI